MRKLKSNIFRYVVALASLVFVAQACGNKSERPSNLVPEETMQSVMLELYLFEGAASVKQMPIGDSTKVAYYNLILKKHHISLADFDSTMAWYSKNLKELNKMHKIVLDSIEARNKALNPEIQEQ